MSADPIGILDSGVGGLSILLKIKKTLPNENVIYIGDQAYHPYSAKSKKTLEKRVAKISEFLIDRKIKLLVVACNTASCQVLPYIRSKFSLPVVGVVPAVKPVSKIANVAKIAILATGKTTKSTYLSDLVKKFAKNKKVLKINCDGLQEAIEDLNKTKISGLLSTYIHKIKKFQADAVVLACTHYSFLKDDLEEKLEIAVIEPSPAVAQRVASLIVRPNRPQTKTKDLFFSTGDPGKFSITASKLLGYKIIAKKARI